MKLYHRHIILPVTFFIFLLASPLYAYALDVRSLKFSTPDGLSDNTVRHIHQDCSGYIWFATFNGLSRYDGYNIMKYSPVGGNAAIQEMQIKKLMEDSHHILWLIGNNDMITGLDLQTDCFVDLIPEGQNELYRYVKELPDSSVWLWGEHGIRCITYRNGNRCSERIDQTMGLPSDVVIGIEAAPMGHTLISTTDGLCAWKEDVLQMIDSTRQYQWMYATAQTVLAVATNGDIMQIGHTGQLQQIGKIDGVSSRQDLPGAFVLDGKWYLTSTHGGMVVDLASYEVTSTPRSLDVISAKAIIDNHGDVWLHNETGYLFYLEPQGKRLIGLHLIPESVMRLIDMERYAIARDKQGRAWITTAENGLFVFTPSTGELEHITTAGDNYQILPSDNVLSVTADNQGNIWIGTEHAGAVMLKPNNDRVQQLSIPRTNGREVSVRMIKKLPDGSISISARDGNLYKYSPDLKRYEVMPRGTIIYDMACDGKGNYWEASRGEGLLVNGTHPKSKVLSSTSNNLFAVLIDQQERIWVGTFGQGLDVLMPTDDSSGYEKRNFLNKNYAQRRIRALFEDASGHIWVATNGGAYRFEPERLLSGADEGVLYSIENQTLRSNEVHCFEQDAQGRIWIGEAGNGITILDFSENNDHPIVTHIGTESGMGHNNVQAFVKEGDEYIWATTLYGASRIDTETLGVESFVFLSDPTANIHTANSAVTLDDGRLLLGTTQGAYTVDIHKIESNQTTPSIVVSSFKVNGERIRFVPDNEYLRQEDGRYCIMLPYDRNNLEFDFSTFDFESPKQTKFRYRLLPLDKRESQASVENRIQLKNLPSGDYTLVVEVCGTTGQWDRRFECQIIIEYPWWSSWWAKILYAILFITGTVMVFKVVRRINELHNKVKVEEQLTDYKLEFFTNISHEFRTPLTLIQVSLEKVHEKIMVLKEDNPGISLNGLSLPLATLDKNSRRMSRLIDELLTFRKVEKNKLMLFPEETEVIGFLREIYDNFKDEALSKRLVFRMETNCDKFVMNVDRNALDKIVNNLISNAIKYTREGGGNVRLIVDAEPSKHLLRIRVIDNGIGFSPDKKKQLFSRFMQSTMSRNSIGVGLHLTFGLVELHKGNISHTDNPDGGSIFTVELPTDMAASENVPQEGIGRPSFDIIFKAEDYKEPLPEATASLQEQQEAEEPRKKMLIIDDDSDIRTFLSNEFSRNFDIITACDGRSGLDATRNNDVNIVICDVMMLDMSGFEVTRLLKEDFATSHIPIIQLTALSNEDCQIEGITSGADAYITKPFNLKFLKTCVAKLIEQRENLFAKYSANPTMARPQLPMGDKDKAFADKLTEIAERQLDNSDFSVDDFAAEMAMGRTIFFRKVKGITGYAPKEYLRVMRMKKAAEMLLSTDMTITEISYRVGISDPAYFNKCFKAQFGKAPSVYQRENTQNNEGEGD